LSITEQIRADITRAIKAGEKDLVGALRAVREALSA
jgi:uncharacterized protein YqeY